MDYAIIKVGNKQHRVRDGETLVVDRVRGPKIRIGKYRRRTGYRRHNGFRAATSRIQISLAAAAAARPKTAGAAKSKAPAAKATAEAPAQAADEAVAKPKAQAKLPKGYDELKVWEIKEQAESWSKPQLETALAHEQANAARKGAIAVLESALARKGD
jgi:hypothetical protein